MQNATCQSTVYFTALSFAVALIASVFSVSHLPAHAAETQHSEPCAEHHMPAPDLFEATCASICDAVDLERLIAVAPDRISVQDTSFVLAEVIAPVAVQPEKSAPRTASPRGPPPAAVYLSTKRLRI